MKESDFSIDPIKKAAVYNLPCAEVYTAKAWEMLVNSAGPEPFLYVLPNDGDKVVSVKEHLKLVFFTMMFISCSNFGEYVPRVVALQKLVNDPKFAVISPTLEAVLRKNPVFADTFKRKPEYMKRHFVEPLYRLHPNQSYLPLPGRFHWIRKLPSFLSILGVYHPTQYIN
jgi:hypothetical protein